MNLGVNNDVNLETKKASLKLMDGGPSKINPPGSHPSNPIHKKATEDQGIGGVKKKAPHPKASTAPADIPATQTDSIGLATQTQPTKTDSIEPHHVNKALVAVGALALAGFVVWARS